MQPAVLHLMHEVERSHWWFVARRRIVMQLLDACLAGCRDALIVDIGCGTGANLATLASRYRCLGVDAAPEAIALARQCFPHIQFIRGQLPYELPLEMSEASVVIATDVLEHVQQDAEALASLVNRLPVGGLVLLTVPADMRLWSTHDVVHGHFRRYTRQSFEQLWCDLPVETLLLSYFNARLCPLIRLLRTLSRWRGKAWGRAQTDVSMPPASFNWLLTSIFGGEARILVETLNGRRKHAYHDGVSLVAILRKRSSSKPT